MSVVSTTNLTVDLHKSPVQIVSTSPHTPYGGSSPNLNANMNNPNTNPNSQTSNSTTTVVTGGSNQPPSLVSGTEYSGDGKDSFNP